MGRPSRILVVDDEQAMRLVLQMRLQDWGYDVRLASDGEAGRRLAESYDPDIVLSDVVMPQLSGLELLRSLKAGDPARPVILMTAQATIDMAVEAMKQGATDFITKPLEYSKLKAIIESAEQEIGLHRAARALGAEVERSAAFGRFIGSSKKMREVYELIESVAASDASAIITGERSNASKLNEPSTPKGVREIADRRRRTFTRSAGTPAPLRGAR